MMEFQLFHTMLYWQPSYTLKFIHLYKVSQTMGAFDVWTKPNYNDCGVAI